MSGNKIEDKKTTTSKKPVSNVKKNHTVDSKPHVVFLPTNPPRPYVYFTKEPKKRIKSIEDISVQTGFSEEFIKKLIKREDIKLEMYKDSKGINTIGVGHNVDADPNYKLGKKITKQQAYELLAKDLITKNKELRDLISPTRLNQNQKEALLDLIFNTGVNQLKNTNLIKNIKEGKFKEACKDFDFILVNNKVSPGLCKRRIHNIYDFSKDDPSQESLDAMKIIQKKGQKVVNANVKKAKFTRVPEMEMRKELYFIETNHYIEKRETEVKKQKQGFFSKLLDFFF